MYLDEKVIATQKTDATTALVNQAQTQASMLKHQYDAQIQMLEADALATPRWRRPSSRPASCRARCSSRCSTRSRRCSWTWPSSSARLPSSSRR